MVSNGYLLLEAISLILLFASFFILINAKKRDITRYLKNKLSGIFFLAVIFMVVFILGSFISFLAIIAFVISFILLLIGFIFSSKVEVRRKMYKRNIPKPVEPVVENEEEAEEVIDKLEKEVKKPKKKITRKRVNKKNSKRKPRKTIKRKK